MYCNWNQVYGRESMCIIWDAATEDQTPSDGGHGSILWLPVPLYKHLWAIKNSHKALIWIGFTAQQIQELLSPLPAPFQVEK